MNLPYKTEGVTPLQSSPALQRLRANLHDLIVIYAQDCMTAPGNSFALTRLTYACAEKREGRYCMRFDGQIKALEVNENIPVLLTITAEFPEDFECYPR